MRTQECAYAARIWCSTIFLPSKCLQNEELWLFDSFRNWVLFGLTHLLAFITIRPHPRPQGLGSSSGVRKMDKRYSTIIFVPHARAKFRKMKVSHRLLFSIVSLVTSSLCLSTFFSVQYFTAISQTHELNKLQKENRELQVANEQFSKSVESLRTQLHTVEDRTRKLASIAGITTLDDTSQGGVGGLRPADRKSTRLNSSHQIISYAVFCLKKKKSS